MKNHEKKHSAQNVWFEKELQNQIKEEYEETSSNGDTDRTITVNGGQNSEKVTDEKDILSIISSDIKNPNITPSVKMRTSNYHLKEPYLKYDTFEKELNIAKHEKRKTVNQIKIKNKFHENAQKLLQSKSHVTKCSVDKIAEPKMEKFNKFLRRDTFR